MSSLNGFFFSTLSNKFLLKNPGSVYFTSFPFPFLHLFLLSNLNELLTNTCLLSKQFKGLRHGYLWRPTYSFGSCAENKVQPVKASVETAPFPLFQPLKDEETASQVKTHFAPCLFIYRLKVTTRTKEC